MLHIMLGHVIHSDRQREIEATLLRRRLLGQSRSSSVDPCQEPVAPRLRR
jgi:hypothetical protein